MTARPLTIEETLETFAQWLKDTAILPAGDYNFEGVVRDFMEDCEKGDMVLPGTFTDPAPGLAHDNADTLEPREGVEAPVGHVHRYLDKWWPFKAREGKNPPMQWRSCVDWPQCPTFQTREVKGG